LLDRPGNDQPGAERLLVAARRAQGGRVGRIDTNGHITLLNETFIQPTGIAIDSGGTVWIAEQGAGTIDHVASRGDVVRYKVDSPFAQPEDLVAAPDGTMWFTEFGSEEVGRFTVANPGD